jgi:hypothetical protein
MTTVLELLSKSSDFELSFLKIWRLLRNFSKNVLSRICTDFLFALGVSRVRKFSTKKPLVPTDKKGCKVFEYDDTATSSYDVDMALGKVVIIRKGRMPKPRASK